MAEALDSLHIALCLFDDQDRALLWNRSFFRLFPEHQGHLSVGEHYSENLRRFYATRLSPAEMGSMAQCVAEGVARHRAQTQPFIFEHRNQWVRVVADPVPGIGRLRIWTPIEAPSKGALTLGPTGTLLPELMSFSAEDGDGATIAGNDGEIVSANSRFAGFFDLSGPEQAIGRTLAEILATAWAQTSETAAAAEPRLQTLAEAERFTGAPFELPLPGDTWLRVLQQRTPDGKLFSTYADISATKRLQRDLDQARQSAEAASRAKDGFLATVSHELRTPMNGILGMLDVLDDGRLAEDQRERIGLARQSAEALLGLLDDILAFSRLEAGHTSMEYAPTSPAAILGEVTRLLQPRAAAKGLSLRWSLDANLPQTVMCDPLRLRQILFNLIGNAVKFTEHGEVSVVAQQGRDAPEGQVLLAFEVRDTGIGIPAAAQEAIFDPFVQAHGGIARRFGGTGLGLAICRRLVQAMNGTIGVESEEGRGSTFCFAIACAPLAVPASRARLPAGSAFITTAVPRRVLVVDDHPTNREVARLLLQRLGMATTTVASGAEALVAGREAFDLILMDLEMPEMDGYATTRAIRASGLPVATTPIVALTAHVGVQHRARCLEVGMQGFVSKPIRIDQLSAAIEEALAAQAAVAPPTRLAPPAAEAPALLSDGAAALASQLGAADWAELVAEFESQCRADLAELMALAGTGAHRKTAHRMKGVAWNLGAQRLGDLAASLEHRPGPEVGACRPELEQLLQATLGALRQLGAAQYRFAASRAGPCAS
jgi:signal transduction histidine kinase/CheY-like chemotaxis protein/HPt (histidine-containing phosphotransfer) domain-containing protein